MSKFRHISEKWLSKEDEKCREGRLKRLDWLAEQLPTSEYLTFPRGLTSKYLFEEARYCFVYGQYLATIVLGFAFIERTLAALFYASGRNELKRANITALLREAINSGWITKKEFLNLEHARKIRNPVIHFRKPLHNDTVELRALLQNELPYDLIEEDARHVMIAVMRILVKHAI